MLRRLGQTARIAIACCALLLTSLALAGVAGAEVRSGSATDPAEGSKPAGRDLIAASASYDTVAGQLGATITTRGAPTDPSTYLGVAFYSVDAAGECAEPIAVLGSEYGVAKAEWLYGAASGLATKSVTGDATTISAAAPGLAGQSFGCVTVQIYEIVEGEGGAELGSRVDYLVQPFRIVGPPPPPPLPPPPPPKVAKLGLAKPGPLTLKRNTWKKVKVTVANEGSGGAGKVKLKVGKAKGVALKPKSGVLKLKAIGAGASKTASFKVKLGAKAKKTSKLTLTVTGTNGLKAKSALIVKLKQKKKRPPKGGGSKGGGSLAGRIFTRYDMTDTTHSAYLEGYAFIDDTWAYNDIPNGGLPRCTEVTGNSKQAGCVRYKYDPQTGAVQVGALTGGKVTKEDFEIEGESYEELTIPKAGTTYQVSQYFMGFSGLCGLITGCTTWRSDMIMTKGGEFALSSSSTTTTGGSGVPFIAVGSYPPDEHGTYRIEGNARIRLSFADGTVENKTIAIFRDKAGKPNPADSGFILDDDYFTFAGDE